MSSVSIRGLTKKFAGNPPTTAMDDLSLDVEEGEFLVLLGPSGCGKTTTLRCLAGLETPDQGSIRFGDKTVYDSRQRIDVSADKRNIGMVFQSYALWPHLTVRKNIGYPLRARKLRGPKYADWVQETADIVDCGKLLERLPGQLSGGQQQRVALARGLVARPELVLFDEPLSNLDARLRDLVRGQLHELHGKLGFSAVFVTHDQREALSLADRVAIMRAGRFEQVGTPKEIFNDPRSEYVAEFTGMSGQLVLSRQGERWMQDTAPVYGEVPVPEMRTVHVRLRPEDIELLPAGAEWAPGHLGIDGEVADCAFGGRELDVVVAVGGTRLQVRSAAKNAAGRDLDFVPGQPVRVVINPHKAAFFDADGARVHEQSSVVTPVGV